MPGHRPSNQPSPHSITLTPNHKHLSTSCDLLSMAAPTKLDFRSMAEDEMRQWVVDNPERVNHLDDQQHTILLAAVWQGHTTLGTWLIDNKGVSMDGHVLLPRCLLHFTRSAEVMTVLLDRGLDPTVVLEDGRTLLMWQRPGTWSASGISWKSCGWPQQSMQQ